MASLNPFGAKALVNAGGSSKKQAGVSAEIKNRVIGNASKSALPQAFPFPVNRVVVVAPKRQAPGFSGFHSGTHNSQRALLLFFGLPKPQPKIPNLNNVGVPKLLGVSKKPLRRSVNVADNCEAGRHGSLYYHARHVSNNSRKKYLTVD